MAKVTSRKVSEDKIVRDVIKKYGQTIDLKESPYVLIEILRVYGSLFQDEDGGLPPGGAPTPPPPGPEGRRIDTALLLAEIQKLSRHIQALQGKRSK